LEDIHYKSVSKKNTKQNATKGRPKIEYEYETENVNKNVSKKKLLNKN